MVSSYSESCKLLKAKKMNFGVQNRRSFSIFFAIKNVIFDERIIKQYLDK